MKTVGNLPAHIPSKSLQVLRTCRGRWQRDAVDIVEADRGEGHGLPVVRLGNPELRKGSWAVEVHWRLTETTDGRLELPVHRGVDCERRLIRPSLGKASGASRTEVHLIEHIHELVDIVTSVLMFV